MQRFTARYPRDSRLIAALLTWIRNEAAEADDVIRLRFSRSPALPTERRRSSHVNRCRQAVGASRCRTPWLVLRAARRSQSSRARPRRKLSSRVWLDARFANGDTPSSQRRFLVNERPRWGAARLAEVASAADDRPDGRPTTGSSPRYDVIVPSLALPLVGSSFFCLGLTIFRRALVCVERTGAPSSLLARCQDFDELYTCGSRDTIRRHHISTEVKF
ncbi:hypothetical protein HPB51_010839 [Rhipicephalus microplus]|uniref:Uncharacterized protein n=1 Tax=Rhipicephalus microplus TaxID=6941 RepID=A0A9J6DLV5_RHIMP|nr:hypothetical protein HPB51_010839 [Rhipicephalus microplus]